jgi:wobble nucleotide-excising tRNase
MIQSISVSDIATYDSTGVQIQPLRAINFIYGANGSGKTTITNLLAAPKDERPATCGVDWQHGTALQTLVYNKQFRERNFGKGSINGVFTLGEATQQEKAKLEDMVNQLDQVKIEISKKNENIRNLNELVGEIICNFGEETWRDIYKKYEFQFKQAFKGAMSKNAFKKKLIEQLTSNRTELLSYDILKAKADTIFGEVPSTLPRIQSIEYSQLIEIESHVIWEKKIIGKGDIQIAELIQRLNLNDWVNEGRQHVNDTEICPFCQERTISDSFRKQLGDYFDETYTQDTDQVKVLSLEYNRLADNLSNLLQEIESAQKADPKTKINLDKLISFNKTASTQILTNHGLLDNKQKEPSRSIQLASMKAQLDEISGLIVEANNRIQEHNAIVTNYAKEKTALIRSIWRYITEESKEKINTYNTKLAARHKGINEVGAKVERLAEKQSELQKEIIEAHRNVTSVQPSVDEMNRVLSSYGFLNFEIVPDPTDKNQYQIQREDGSIAESTLSEGEITFITFLYFLQLAKGGLTEDTVANDRVLVIDDPISSLDSNILFVVSSLIKELIESTKKGTGNIKQMILLTHNVYFHKEVSYISGKAQQDKDTAYWILRKKDKITAIQPHGMDNPIHSSYELLWRELENRKHNDGISIQNIMRRIIENYFKILGKYRYDDLIHKFETLEEQGICRSMVCWINNGSHGIPDDLYVEHSEATVDKYFDVFEKIFIKMKHHEHFKMMMQIEDDTENPASLEKVKQEPNTSKKKTILVLANSIKKGGRCVAGIELKSFDANSVTFGDYIRPIDATQEEGTLLLSTTTLNNKAVGPLDIVEIEFSDNANDLCHPEDWIIRNATPWKALGKLPIAALEKLPYNRKDLWGNTKSITPGSSTFSLQVIKTEKPYTVQTYWQDGRFYPVIRCQIEIGNLKTHITDPNFTKKYEIDELELDHEIEFQIATGSFILLSLTPPFTNNYDYTAQYKVVAAIIENDA